MLDDPPPVPPPPATSTPPVTAVQEGNTVQIKMPPTSKPKLMMTTPKVHATPMMSTPKDPATPVMPTPKDQATPMMSTPKAQATPMMPRDDPLQLTEGELEVLRKVIELMKVSDNASTNSTARSSWDPPPPRDATPVPAPSTAPSLSPPPSLASPPPPAPPFAGFGGFGGGFGGFGGFGNPFVGGFGGGFGNRVNPSATAPGFDNARRSPPSSRSPSPKSKMPKK